MVDCLVSTGPGIKVTVPCWTIGTCPANALMEREPVDVAVIITLATPEEFVLPIGMKLLIPTNWFLIYN